MGKRVKLEFFVLLESSRSFTLNTDSKNGKLENGGCRGMDLYFSE